MVILEVDSVAKSYGETVALNGVTLSVEHGEILGLLGPNGAGKSTLMHLVSGLLRPDRGNVLLEGGTDPSQPAARHRVGLAPQSLALYEELTASENLSFVGKLYGLRGSKLAERVDWALGVAGLKDRRRHRVRSFSGGMKRRLNLVCALMHQPRLVLLDEPTVGVDPQTRAHLFETIEGLRADGTSVVYATHYMEEAARLADRVAIIDHGKLMAMGSVDELIREHGGSSQVALRPRHPLPEDASLPALDADGCATWETDHPLEDLVRLSRAGVEWDEVSISRPDLESVFLKLTGRTLRDSGESSES